MPNQIKDFRIRFWEHFVAPGESNHSSRYEKITPLTLLTCSALGSVHAATISTANLGALDLSGSGLSIVHGTDLTNPRVQEAIWNATGIFLSTTNGNRLGRIRHRSGLHQDTAGRRTGR